ncbi:hypothetical protein BTVI_114631 [Pitangus sulphuratus]|nr:hypothetical protein BTVI_114631 [Pitangus sulphuratus]
MSLLSMHEEAATVPDRTEIPANSWVAWVPVPFIKRVYGRNRREGHVALAGAFTVHTCIFKAQEYASARFQTTESGETLAQVAQRNCGYPIPGSVQGQTGWGFEQSGLMEGPLPVAVGLELHDLQTPYQLKAFYDSRILWFPRHVPMMAKTGTVAIASFALRIDFYSPAAGQNIYESSDFFQVQIKQNAGPCTETAEKHIRWISTSHFHVMCHPSDSTTKEANKPFACMIPPCQGALAGTSDQAGTADGENSYHTCVSPPGIYPLGTTGRGPFDDCLEKNQLSSASAPALQSGWGRNKFFVFVGPQHICRQPSWSHHCGTEHETVCKMGFSPAEAQKLKLQMISAEDSQKEGQP